MRFDLARAAGLTEDLVDRIDDGHADAELPPRVKAALRFTDRFVSAPALPTELEAADMAEHFDRGELIELALGVGLFHGFSKMLIGLGREPEGMPTTILPTPPAPTEPATSPSSFGDPYVAVLSDRPDLACRWGDLHQMVWTEPPVAPAVLRAVRGRIAGLLGSPLAGVDADVEPVGWSEADRELLPAAIAMAELFVIDIRALGDDQVTAVSDRVGPEGLVHLMTAMALWDGLNRVAVTVPAPSLS